MGRRRAANVSLPDGVQKVVKPSGRTYYYFAPGRGTKRAGKRVPLGRDAQDPEFWRLWRDAKVGAGQVREGTFSVLIADFRASHEWARLRKASRETYDYCLNRLEAEAGDRLVRAMTRKDVYLLRDGMTGTPVAANLMLSVLRVIVEWGIPRGYRDDNPTTGMRRLVIEESGAQPWSEEAYRFVLDKAPENLRRMAFLGRATGQRASDLVRMRPADLVEDGINIRIGKRRDKPHFVPLTRAQMKEIRSWGVRDLDFFLTSTLGKRCSAGYLNSLWNAWRRSEEAEPIKALKLTIHGLRATAVADRRRAGTEDGAIADEIGMSVRMVTRYVRFADKAASARASRDRREQAEIGFENSVVNLKTEGP